MDIGKLFASFGQFMSVVTKGVARIFSPDDDEYPETGVQPFSGEPYQESSKFED